MIGRTPWAGKPGGNLGTARVFPREGNRTSYGALGTVLRDTGENRRFGADACVPVEEFGLGGARRRRFAGTEFPVRARGPAPDACRQWSSGGQRQVEASDQSGSSVRRSVFRWAASGRISAAPAAGTDNRRKTQNLRQGQSRVVQKRDFDACRVRLSLAPSISISPLIHSNSLMRHR